MESLSGSLSFFIDSFVLLFAVMNPLAIVALFVTMTATYPRQQCFHMNRIGSIVAFGILLFFAIFGEGILNLLGITLPAFRIAGGLLILSIGFSMLRSEEGDELSPEEEKKLQNKHHADLSITPLAVPIIAGPGSISATILKSSEAHGFAQWLGLFGGIFAVILCTYVFLDISLRGSKFLGKTAMRLCFRLSGLVLIALAVQFILMGIEQSQIGRCILGA